MTSAAPSLLESFDNWGALIFYAAWCVVALVYVFLFVPEIATLSLEEMNDIFKGSWFKAYRSTRRSYDVRAAQNDGESVDQGYAKSDPRNTPES